MVQLLTFGCVLLGNATFGSICNTENKNKLAFHIGINKGKIYGSIVEYTVKTSMVMNQRTFT